VSGLPTQAGFRHGDVYVSAPLTGGCSGFSYGIVHYDVRTGQLRRLIRVDGGGGDYLHYDAYRDRLLTRGSLTPGVPASLIAVDASGNATSIDSCYAAQPAPTGKGIVYLDVGQLWYVDRFDVCHPVIDSRTGSTFVFTGQSSTGYVVYSPTTNSLYRFGTSTCAPSVVGPTVVRVDFSANGKRVVDSTLPESVNTCGRIANGIDRGPLGGLLAIDHGTAPLSQTQVLSIDPVTLDPALYFDYPGPTNPAFILSFNVGAYSEWFQEAVLAGGAATAAGNVYGLWLAPSGTPLYVSAPNTCPFAGATDVEVIQ
jgi:hypothetical protein